MSHIAAKLDRRFTITISTINLGDGWARARALAEAILDDLGYGRTGVAAGDISALVIEVWRTRFEPGTLLPRQTRILTERFNLDEQILTAGCTPPIGGTGSFIKHHYKPLIFLPPRRKGRRER